MNNKNDFIVRLNELLTEGEALLQTNGIPLEKIDVHKKSNVLELSYYSLDSSQQAKEHLYTYPIPTVDYNRGIDWIMQVHRCLLNFLGKDDNMTYDLEWDTRKSSIEKEYVEKTLVKLRATKSAAEKRDIVVISEVTNMDNVKIKSDFESMISNKIFIVHGHDIEAKNKVELFVRKIGFDPVILSEQANMGKTIIEKVEEYTDVIFGIVLYTPCDVTSEGKSRARQNVILEHGFLMGKLGRSKVCALVKGDVEKPSDIDGIVYIEMDDKNAWELGIVKELKAVGYDADANKL